MPSATGALGQFVAAKELREALQRPLQKRDTRNDASSLPLPETHKLKVEVIEATDLLAYDRGGTSDPLVRCQLFLKQCASLKPLQPILATKEVPKTLAPTWGETLDFEFVDGAAVLRCTVLDKDMLGTDLMGIVEVDLSVLARRDDGPPLEAWLPLRAVPGMKPGKTAAGVEMPVAGKLRLKLTYVRPKRAIGTNGAQREHAAGLEPFRLINSFVEFDDEADEGGASGCGLVVANVRSRYFKLRFATGFETELKLNCLSAAATAGGGLASGAKPSATPAVAFRLVHEAPPWALAEEAAAATANRLRWRERCDGQAEQLEITVFAGRGLGGPDPFSAAAAAVVASTGKAGSALTFAALAAAKKEPRVKLSIRLVDSCVPRRPPPCHAHAAFPSGSAPRPAPSHGALAPPRSRSASLCRRGQDRRGPRVDARAPRGQRRHFRARRRR